MLNDWEDFVTVYGERGKRWFGCGRFVSVSENHHASGNLPKWQVWVGSGDADVLAHDERFPYGFMYSASLFTGAQSEAYKRAEMLARAVVLCAGFDRHPTVA